MRKVSVLLLLFLSLTTVLAPPIGEQRSISTSRQFLLYGGDVALRGAIGGLAERTKSNLLELLNLRDHWKTPLIIKLVYPQANYPDAPDARLEVSQLGYGLKMQFNLLVTDETEASEIQRELLRAILIEMMYRERGNIAAGTPYFSPPDWLLDGILRLQPGQDSDESAQLLQTVVATNKIAPLEEVIRQAGAQLDASSRRLFSAYSQALLQLLLEAPEGRKKLAQYIRDLPEAPNDAFADLRAHFPETLGRTQAKWWTLAVARLSVANRYEILSVEETAALLGRLLRFPIAGSDGKTQQYSLGDYAKFRKLPGYRGALEQVARQLLLLSARAHPCYRAILQEDYELAHLLARGKTKRVRERLERVATYRTVIERQVNEIDDYLNWYEATQPKTMSGAFRQLLKNAQADGESPHRRDPISIYLDSIEMEMP